MNNPKKREENEIVGNRSEVEDQVSGRHLNEGTAQRMGSLVVGAWLVG